jgi:hypothetical protein
MGHCTGVVGGGGAVQYRLCSTSPTGVWWPEVRDVSIVPSPPLNIRGGRGVYKDISADSFHCLQRAHTCQGDSQTKTPADVTIISS